MVCPKCGAPMNIRNGKYGEFYYCTEGNHCTINVAKYNEIIGRFNAELIATDNDPLQSAIEKQTLTLGGVVNDMERMYVDCEASYNEPDDFWQNIRPY